MSSDFRFPIVCTWLLAGVMLVTGVRGAEAARTLDWDETDKEYTARPDETAAVFVFTATNNTAETVLVFEAVPSCGCTVVRLPTEPWSLARGASGMLKASVDLTGKHGQLEKTIEVRSSVGNETLRLRVLIPEDPATAAMDRRTGNEQIARTDRQAVFRNGCASCHVPASSGLTAADLFRAACAICHESPHRASMVPDLAERGAGKKADYWTRWIESGRSGSLMPAFAMENHGILTSAQVGQLVEYLTRRYGSVSKR